MFSNVEEALECLGDEARAVFDGTVEGSWEYRPQCVDPYDATWYEWCDDCETFHQSWYVFGYEVTKGQVEALVWQCDMDGDWDVSDSAFVGTEDMGRLHSNYGHEAWQRSYARYLRHVGETGEDPCGEFGAISVLQFHQDWIIHVLERGDRVWVTHCKRLAQSGAVCEIWERAGNLPEHVKEYLLLEKLGDVSAYAIDPENVKSIADLDMAGEWEPGERQNEWSVQVQIIENRPTHTDEQWADVLREKANKARAEMVFSDS